MKRKGNPDLGLLVLRLWFGLEMAVAHGFPKLQKLLAGNFKFPDPIGLGAPVSLGLATFGELVCGLLIAVGLYTRLASVPYLITMLVAAFVIHGGDGWGKMSVPLLYAAAAMALLLCSPGRGGTVSTTTGSRVQGCACCSLIISTKSSNR